MADFHKADVAKLIDGVLPWPAVQDMMKSPKDTDRFDKYVEILQDRVDWDERILLPLTPQLYIVAKNGSRLVKCVCGHEFGDYRVNWKLSSLINVRDTEEALSEVYKGREMPDPSWIQVREYICPGCGSQLEVEAVPRGCPPDFDFLPDLDTFYREWLRRPLPDEVEYRDLTPELVDSWSLPDYTKPLPELDGFAADFYGFCREGELRFQRCKACGVWRHVPREMCAECGSFDWEWARSSGRGTVFSWTVVERALHPEFAKDTPYAAVVVEMEEGPRLISQVVDCDPADLEIGMAVDVVFEEVTHDVTLPKFKLRRHAPVRARRNGAGGHLELPATIRYERADHLAIMTIDRPDSMNSLTKEMLGALDAAFADFDADDDLWVAILTASGDRSFCTGMDLKEAVPLLTSGDELGYEDHTKRQFSDVFKPIIGAVNGHCIAGGLEMLAGTDIRIAAEHATFGLGEVRWGLVPAGGSHVRVPRQIPWAVAMELLLTGDPIDAQRAYEVGLVNRVVPSSELLQTAMDVAARICRNGPLAVRTSKEIAVRTLGLESGFVLEKALAARVFASDDAKEGPRAFTEKRKPDFKGR
ncbi:MAG: enoyl-CoA hydratase-related protein [Acidimicrobiia bacterium]